MLFPLPMCTTHCHANNMDILLTAYNFNDRAEGLAEHLKHLLNIRF